MHAETREAKHGMQVIMEEDHYNQTQSSAHTSFSRLRSFKLNDMGFGLNRISPITFDADAFQTPENRGPQNKAPTSTPWERGTQLAWEEAPHQGPSPMNRTYPLNRVPTYLQEQRHQLYDADTSLMGSLIHSTVLCSPIISN